MMRLERINSVQTAAYQLAMLRPTRMRDRTMNMSSESLLVILFVGPVAGWLAGQIVRGTGFGIVGDLIVGILGAFIGSWLWPQLGIHLGTGVISAIVHATIGAILLLLIVRLLRGRGGWGSRWGGGWWGRRWCRYRANHQTEPFQQITHLAAGAREGNRKRTGLRQRQAGAEKLGFEESLFEGREDLVHAETEGVEGHCNWHSIDELDIAKSYVKVDVKI